MKHGDCYSGASIADSGLAFATGPGERLVILHSGPPTGILLAVKTTREFHFVGMPPGTILLTPISTKIRRHRKRQWQQKKSAAEGYHAQRCWRIYAFYASSSLAPLFRAVVAQLKTHHHEICSPMDNYRLRRDVSLSEKLGSRSVQLLSVHTRPFRNIQLYASYSPQNLHLRLCRCCQMCRSWKMPQPAREHFAFGV
jgi:hypothetical protein